MSKGLDLSKFEKMSSDKDSTTLRHPDGHSIKLAHKALSPKMMAEIEKLPSKMSRGGSIAAEEDRHRIKGVHRPVRDENGDLRGTSDVGGYARASEYKPAADIAKLKHAKIIREQDNMPKPKLYAEGGGAESSLIDPTKLKAYMEANYGAPPQVDTNPITSMASAADDAVKSGIASQIKSGHGQPIDYSKSDNDNSTQAAQVSPQDSEPSSGATGTWDSESQPPEAEPVMQPEPIAPKKPAAPPVSPPPATPPIDRQAPNPNNYLTEPVSAADATQAMNNETAKLKADWDNGTINPVNYHDLFHDRSLPGKIGTIFGLMISGYGSGVTGQPNALLEMMNKQIDNDLQAQKEAKTNQFHAKQLAEQHLVNKSHIALQGSQIGLNKANVGLINSNIQINTDAHAKNLMLIKIMHDLTNTTNNLPPAAQPAAKAALQHVTNQATNQMAVNNAQAAQQTEANFAKRQAGLALFPELSATATLEGSKHVPGLGEFSQPVDKKDANRILAITKFQNMLKEADQLRALPELQKALPSVKARGLQLKSDMIASYPEVKDLVRLSNTDADLYGKILPNAADIFKDITGSNKAQLDRMNASIEFNKQADLEQMGHIKDQFGNPVYFNHGGNQGQGSTSPQQGMVPIVDSSGGRHLVPAANLDKALKRGFKRAP